MKFFPAAKTISLVMTFSAFLAVHSQVGKSGDEIYTESFVTGIMEEVYTWQVENPVSVNHRNDADWARAAFYIGVMRAYQSTRDKNYLKGARKYAKNADWKPALRFYHADDVACGQVYLDLYKVKGKPFMISGIKQRIDSLMADPKKGKELWWWCDALFMSPPVIARLYEITGETKYKDYLNANWWDTAEFLFDKEEHLFYRDKRFFDQRSANGKKIFWSRGNGWVMAGLAQVMERIPEEDPYYPQYKEIFRKMATKIASLQQDDGLWRPGLLDPDEISVKETSGSGFYTFALAWGINQGILEREKYLPVVRKGWTALTKAVSPEGKLTWVQPIGAQPDAVKERDNQEYGSGAFLMAGTEIIRLNK